MDQISISNYATFGNNPIKIIDHNGDKIRPWDDMEEDRSNYYKNRKNNPPKPKYFVDIGNLNKFNSQMIELMSTNKIFDSNYWLLESSKTEYKIEQINVYGYAGYSIENKLIRIGVKGYGDDAGISKGDLFEEFFHAGQDEFYSSLGIKRSDLEDEVEAKIANLLSGFKDITLKQEYTAIKEYFETGKKNKDFNKELDGLIKDVYDTYKRYKPNMFSKSENQPKNVNKKNVLKYLDYLNKKIKNNEESK